MSTFRMFVTWVSLTIGTFCLNWRICDTQEISHVSGVVTTGLWSLLFLYLQIGIAVYLLTLQSFVDKFVGWNKWLQNNVNYQTLVTSGYEYIKALEYANQVGSAQMFNICFTITVATIAVFYRAFSFGLGKQSIAKMYRIKSIYLSTPKTCMNTRTN